MNYAKLFNKILLEDAQPPSLPNPRTHNVPDDSINSALDQDTDPDSFLTQGIKQTFDQVQQHFDEKMTEFAQSISPESVKNLTLNQLKQKMGSIYNFVNKVQVFSKAKIDSMAQDPYAIMAGFVASDPTKLASFAELHKTIEEFQQFIEDIESHVSSVNSKIADFVSDGSSPDSPDLDSPNPASQKPNSF